MSLTSVEVERGLQALYDADGIGTGRSQVFDVMLLGSGFETDVFAFSLKSAQANAEERQDLILRLYAGEDTSEKAAREFAVMERLRTAGYPVPGVLALKSAGSLFGRPFILMERIHGVSLGKSYWSSAADRRQAAAALLWRLIAELHAMEGSAILPDAPLAEKRDPYAFIEYELSALSELLRRLEGQEPPSLRDALAWLISRRSAVPCERLVVVHSDFHPNNVLLRTDGVPFVIDWSNARPADYRTELAWTLLITGADSPLEKRKAELRLYEQLVGREVANLEYFEVAACLKLLLSTLISLRFGAARQGMRPEAEALMRRDASHTWHVAALLQERTKIAMPDLEDALSTLLG